MPISRFISRPCFDSLGSSSSTDHQDDGAVKPGGSRRLAGLICDRALCPRCSTPCSRGHGSQHLSTEAGPVAGLLFISTERVAFCSQRSITSRSLGGQPIETDKKIEIPIRNIRELILNDPQQKNMIKLTTDNSEFQFTDFLRYDKACQNLQEAILWQSLTS
ncbi:GEM protein [Salix suchowensis]|nr:GEM protein [Salix suchowensis]